MSNTEDTSPVAPEGRVPDGAAPRSSPDGGVDIWEYLRIIRRRWLLIVLSVLVVVGLTAFVTLRMTKIYRATSTVQIETQAPQVLGKDIEDVVEMGTGSFWSNVEYYETQYRIIESRDVSMRVVKRYRLNEDPEFMGIPKEERGAFEPATLEEAAEVLQSMITVEPVKDSRLTKVHVENPDPERALLYANAVVDAYVDKNLETMLQSTVDAVDWLSKQLDEAKSELTQSEEKLRSYKKENSILSISLEDRQNLLAAQMTAAAANLTEARSKRIEIQARKNAFAKAAKVEDPMAIPLDALNSNPLIQQLKQKFAELSQDYGELDSRYGENHTKIVEIKAKMERIREDIAREVSNVISSVDAELVAARSTEAGLEKALDELKAQAQELADKEGPYRTLAREADNNEEVYKLLLGRTKEADLSKLLRVNNVTVLDRALLPEAPVKPRIHLNLALAFIFGLLLGVGLAVLIEFADRTVKTQEDLEALGVSFLGIVPSIDSSTTYGSTVYGSGGSRKKRAKVQDRLVDGEINFDNFVHEHPKSQVAESLRSIRTNLLFMSADRSVRRLLVTSPSPQEGKTTVAANLAIVMAQSGSRVLLVDTDMRRPRVHKAFGIARPRVGLSTMILGESTAERAISQTGMENLDVLVCGPTPPNPSELIHTDAFRAVVDEISGMYDRVIFDSPPVGVVTDAAILSKMVDGTILIVKSLKTTRDAARHAIGTLKDIDAEILGAVLNDLDLNNRKYGQHYYHYYKKYGYYYDEGQPGADDEGKGGSA